MIGSIQDTGNRPGRVSQIPRSLWAGVPLHQQTGALNMPSALRGTGSGPRQGCAPDRDHLWGFER